MPRVWDQILPQAEFTCNNTIHSSTGTSPFSIVYRKVPHHLLDFAKLSIGKKFSNAASDKAGQAIVFKRRFERGWRNPMQGTRPQLIKGGKERSSNKGTW